MSGGAPRHGDPGVVVRLLADDGTIPNNPRLPLLLYRAALDLSGARDPASRFEDLFAANGWTGAWRNGIHPFHHFHATAHEVLGIYAGESTVMLGGEAGVTVTVTPGDVVIIPAGVGHKRLAARGRLGVVGAYPAGQRPDLNRAAGSGAERAAIAAVPVPPLDPVHGATGPMHAHWRG